jgi:membrane-associated phospholipid phosphatase
MRIIMYIKNYPVLFITAIQLCCCDVAIAQNWDVNLLKKFNTDPPDSKYWNNTSNSAYWAPSTIIAGTFLSGVTDGNGLTRNQAYETLLSVGLGTLVSEFLKFTVKEERPSDRYPGEIFVNSPTNEPSFPSGHTVLVFATATSLALEYKRWYVSGPAFLWAGSLAFSRMYLGKHYPSDVLAGMAIGIISGVASHRLSVGIFKSYRFK